MKKRVGLKFKGSKVFINVEKANKLRGLMFKTRNDARALLFEFDGKEQPSLHSLFVFFPFLTLWLDDKNKVLETKVVKPFSLNVFSKKPFSRIVEVPINRNYREIIKKLMKTRRQGKI